MFLTENKVVYLSDFKDDSMDYEKIVQDLDLQSESIYESVPLNEGRKRMRLHQLTWEEKIQRKKLRNRIAAQTSRDRKKAKMDYLEESVKDLKQQNELLFLQIEELKKKNEMLVDANAELQLALAQRSYSCSCKTKVKEENGEIIERPSEIEEQICAEDGHSCGRPAESEIPQQKGTCLPSFSEMLGNLKEDTFLDDLERLASSLLEEVEQNNIRDTKPEFKEISGTGPEKCIYNTKMVGEASEKLESSGGKIDFTSENQQHCLQFTELTTREKINFISSEHSYAVPRPLESSKIDSSSRFNIPAITLTESDQISAIENELKKDIEPNVLTSEDNLDISTFPDFASPRSEVSSDQGYESVGSPYYESEVSKADAFDNFSHLSVWGDPFSELFPELL